MSKVVIVPGSHVDHQVPNLTQLVDELDLPEGVTSIVTVKSETPLPCALRGPIMGDPPVPDEVCTMVVRNGRGGPSRVLQSEDEVDVKLRYWLRKSPPCDSPHWASDENVQHHQAAMAWCTDGDTVHGKPRDPGPDMYKPIMTTQVTLVVGMHEGQLVLFTAFPGPAAPREPWDPSLDEAGRKESTAFWAVHALAL